MPNGASVTEVRRSSARLRAKERVALPATSLFLAGALVLTIIANGGSPIRTVRVGAPSAGEQLALRTGQLSNAATTEELIPYYLGLTAIALGTALLAGPRRRCFGVVVWCLCIGIYMAMSSLWSYAPLSTLNSAWAIGFTSPCAAVIAMAIGGQSSSNRLAKSLLRVLLGIAVLVTLLRVPNGLLDRSAPFFICGPIVWGWLMAVGILCVMQCWGAVSFATKALSIPLLVIGLIASGSRGALVSLLVAVGYLCWQRGKKARFALVVVVAIVGASMLFAATHEHSEASPRLVVAVSDTFRVLMDDETALADHPLFNRWGHLSFAMPRSFEGWLMGNGPRHFGAVETTESLGYPHNVFIDLLDSYGIAAPTALALLILCALRRACAFLGSVIVLFTFALCSSGDLSYLRYLLPWCLLAIYRGADQVRPMHPSAPSRLLKKSVESVHPEKSGGAPRANLRSCEDEASRIVRCGAT